MKKQFINMKIFINADTYKEIAQITKEKLIETANELGIEISEDINEADIICSIGGDGTFLESSKLALEKPIIGINCGTLGYLTDVNPEGIKKTMEDIIDGNYYIEERMMLEAEIIKESGEIMKMPPALNEMSISKNIFGVVRFDAIVDGKLINSYTADGILICTPTGSTAYNLSCGGPIVDPTAEIITITPIAPHTIINRSIVLSDKSIVEIKITELRENTSSYALSDGKSSEIETGDVLKIKKSDAKTKIIKLNWQSFIDTVRDKIN